MLLVGRCVRKIVGEVPRGIIKLTQRTDGEGIVIKSIRKPRCWIERRRQVRVRIQGLWVSDCNNCKCEIYYKQTHATSVPRRLSLPTWCWLCIMPLIPCRMVAPWATS